MQLKAWQWGHLLTNNTYMQHKIFSSSILGGFSVVISKIDAIFALMEHLKSRRESQTKQKADYLEIKPE